MKTLNTTLLATVAAMPLMAQETRELDAHVHGVSTLELAAEHGILEINLLSPGADIVGFEYAARSEADKDAVEAAIRVMLIPENIVALPAAAECRLTEVLAHLHGHDHAHEEGADHDHADHAEDEDHEHEDHADEDHEHGHHDDEDHADEDDHQEGAVHSEFHARYVFACEHPDALTSIGFPFFERFGNAREIEALYVTETGAGAAEISRANPELTLD